MRELVREILFETVSEIPATKLNVQDFLERFEKQIIDSSDNLEHETTEDLLQSAADEVSASCYSLEEIPDYIEHDDDSLTEWIWESKLDSDEYLDRFEDRAKDLIETKLAEYRAECAKIRAQYKAAKRALEAIRAQAMRRIRNCGRIVRCVTCVAHTAKKNDSGGESDDSGSDSESDHSRPINSPRGAPAISC